MNSTENTTLKDQIRALKAKRKITGSFWTRTKTFRKLCQWAFNACDTSKTKNLSKDELYSGLLLVYLNIAKYAGPAACYPPSRSVVDNLFDACDVDKSGGICEEEFVTIIIILSSQMTWRIATYQIFLISLLPYVVDWCINLLCWIGLDDGLVYVKHKFDSYAPELFLRFFRDVIPDSFWDQLPESMTSFAIFCAVIPFCWDRMDRYVHHVAVKKGSSATSQK